MKLSGALLMVVFLLWLPLEDMSIWGPVSLATAFCLWLGWRWQLSQPTTGWTASLRGALLGLAAPLLAIGIMAFKGSLHGHGFPDFTFRQVQYTLALIPISTLIGSLTPSAVFLVSRFRATHLN